MRKQSNLVLVESRKSAVATPKQLEEIDRDEASSYMGLTTPPNPLEKNKSTIRKISQSHIPGNKHPEGRQTMIAKQKKNTSESGKSGQLEAASCDSVKSKPPTLKPVDVVDTLTGYAAMRASTNRAHNLVESILKEDMRWAGVPEQNYHTYKESDFMLKLDSSKIQVLMHLLFAKNYPYIYTDACRIFYRT